MDRLLYNIASESQSLIKHGRTAEAIFALEKTISWSLCQLSMIWGNNNLDLEKAAECLRAAIKINPEWGFYVNLSHTLNTNFKFEEAKIEALNSIKVGGETYETYYNLGVILRNLLDHEGAIKSYETASKLHNGNGHNLADYNAAASMLILGRWKEGWEKYENRFVAFEDLKAIHDRFKVHYHAGDPLDGRKIYVYVEQGIGDLLQFSRYLSRFKEAGAEVIVESQTACAKLLEENFNVNVVPRFNDVWPTVPDDIDYAVSICSLPGMFNAGIEKIPTQPYIKAQNRKMPDILKTDKLKVGICWAGNPSHMEDYRRSSPLQQFAPLFDVDNVQIFSLQKDVDMNRVWCGRYVNLRAGTLSNAMIDLSPHMHDFIDTAYYIDQMDLVITVDTSIVHLAGAMNKPVWLLIDKLNDWRWGLEGDSSEWYPSVRIFRQDVLFDWPSVMQKVRKELESFQIPSRDQS